MSLVVSEQLLVVLKLVVVLLLSAILGWERERRERAAGLRTHMLVGLSATLFAAVGPEMVTAYTQSTAATVESLRFDPLRVLEAVATGVSFLGAGTIFVSGDHVKGLTTAASILATAAVGVTVGIGSYLVAVVATALVMIVLAGVRRLEPVPTRNGDPVDDD
jgi:putative Mg2+ transporter-C (MgtC) family protein